VSDRPDLSGKKDVLVVDSALDTLQELASFHRKQSKITILAITGSNGKTTTKELLAAVMSKKYRVIYTQGNLNNHIGVPLSLLKIKGEEFGIIEMGANHPGEIKLLSEIASPDYGLITNIGKAHLEGFKSLEGVLEAKGELYEYLQKNNKTAFINVKDNMLYNKAVGLGLNFIPYNNPSLYGEVAGVFPFLKCKVCIEGREYIVSTKLVGRYNLQNIIPALAVGKNFGIQEEDMFRAIKAYEPKIQRSQLIEGKSNSIILDAYNANPTSMRESVSDFAGYTKGKKIAILGDMLELGQDALKEHEEMIKWVHNQSIENVIFVGPLFVKAGENYTGSWYFRNVEDCIDHLKKANYGGYHILIKGSRKISLESVTIHLIN